MDVRFCRESEDLVSRGDRNKKDSMESQLAAQISKIVAQDINVIQYVDDISIGIQTLCIPVPE
ncbi:hypothetical protein J6590_000756 [Homalodisca vitripennis]|nr:hypothetical protein J6590_000756 [Homalodisca vitripennis]